MDSSFITAHDLRLLSVGYYIQAGVAAFSTFMLLAYAALATALLANLAKSAGEQAQQQIPPALLPILSILILLLVGLAAAYCVCLFLAGYWLRRFRHMLFVQIVAAFTCLTFPYGTALGIFTFIVLQRPTAKQFFAAPPTPPPLPTPPPVTTS